MQDGETSLPTSSNSTPEVPTTATKKNQKNNQKKEQYKKAGNKKNYDGNNKQKHHQQQYKKGGENQRKQIAQPKKVSQNKHVQLPSFKPLPPFFRAFEMISTLDASKIQQGLQIIIDETEQSIMKNSFSQKALPQHSLEKIIHIGKQQESIPHSVFSDNLSSSDITTGHYYTHVKYIYDGNCNELKFIQVDTKSYLHQLFNNNQFFILLPKLLEYVFVDLMNKGNEYGEKISLLLQVKLFTVLFYIMRYEFPKNEKSPLMIRCNQFLNMILPYLYKYYATLANKQEERTVRRRIQSRNLFSNKKQQKKAGSDEEDNVVDDPNAFRGDDILDNEAMWEQHLYTLFSTIYHVSLYRPEWVCGSLLRGRASNQVKEDTTNNSNSLEQVDLESRIYKVTGPLSTFSFKNIYFGLLRSTTDIRHAPHRNLHTMLIVHHLLFNLLKSCHTYLTVKLPIDCKFCYDHSFDLQLLRPLISTMEYTMVRLPKHRSQLIRSEITQIFKFYVQYRNEYENTPLFITELEQFINSFIKKGQNVASIIHNNPQADPFNLYLESLESPYQFNYDVVWTCLQILSVPHLKVLGDITCDLLKAHPYMIELYLNTIFGNTHDKIHDLQVEYNYHQHMRNKFNADVMVKMLEIIPSITIDHVRKPDRSIPLIVSSLLMERSLLFSFERVQRMLQGPVELMDINEKILLTFVHIFKKFEKMIEKLEELKHEGVEHLIVQYERDLIMEFRKRFPIQPSLFIKSICVDKLVNGKYQVSSKFLSTILHLFRYYSKYYPDQVGRLNIGVILPIISQIVLSYSSATREQTSSENLVSLYIKLLSEMNISFQNDILPNLVLSGGSNILSELILSIDYLAIAEHGIDATNYIAKSKLLTDMFTNNNDKIVFEDKHDAMHWFMMTFFNDQSSLKLIEWIIQYISNGEKKVVNGLHQWDSSIFSDFIMFCIRNGGDSSVGMDYLYRVFVHKFIQKYATISQEKRSELLKLIKKEKNLTFMEKLLQFTEVKNERSMMDESDLHDDQYFYDHLHELSLEDIEKEGSIMPYPILFYLSGLGATVNDSLIEQSIGKFKYDNVNALEYVTAIKERWLTKSYNALYCKLLTSILKRFKEYKDLIFKDESIIKSIQENQSIVGDVINLWKEISPNSIIYDEYISIIDKTLTTPQTDMDRIFFEKTLLANIEIFDYKKFSQLQLANVLVKNKRNAKFVISNIEKFGTFVLYLLLGIDNSVLMKSTKEKTRLVNIAEIVCVMLNQRMVLSTARIDSLLDKDMILNHSLLMNLSNDEFTTLCEKIIQYTCNSFNQIDNQQKQFLIELICWYCRVSNKYHAICLREVFKSMDLANNPNLVVIMDTIIRFYSNKLPEAVYKHFDTVDKFLSTLVQSGVALVYPVPTHNIIKYFTSTYSYDEKQFIQQVVEKKNFELLNLDEKKQTNLFQVYYDLLMIDSSLLQNEIVNQQFKYHTEHMISNKKKRSEITGMINKWSEQVIDSNAMSSVAFEIFDIISSKYGSNYYFEKYYINDAPALYKHLNEIKPKGDALYHAVHFIYILVTKYERDASEFLSNTQVFEFLLSNYGCTMNKTDLIIYSLFNLYETQLSSPLARYHYQFGSRAIVGESLTEQEFVSLEWNNFHQQYDKSILYNTIYHLPHDISLYSNQLEYEFKHNNQVIDCNQVYDIRYVLRYVIYMMTMFPASAIYRQNTIYLSFAFRCTSSQDYYVRMLAYEVISMFYNFIVNHVNRNKQGETIYEVLVLVFRQIKVSIPSPYARLSLPWSMTLCSIINSILRVSEDANPNSTSSENETQETTTEEEANEPKMTEEEEEAHAVLLQVLSSLRDSKQVNVKQDELFENHVKPLLTSTISLNSITKISLKEISRFFEFQNPFLKFDLYPIHRDHVKSINAFGFNYINVLLYGYQSDTDFADVYINSGVMQHLLMSFDQIQSNQSYHVYNQLAVLRILIDVMTRFKISSEKCIKNYGLMDWIKTQFRRCTNSVITCSSNSIVETSRVEIVRLLMVLLCSIYKNQYDKIIHEILLCESSILVNMIVNNDSLLTNMGWKTILYILKYCPDEFKKHMLLNLVYNASLIRNVINMPDLSNLEKIELLVQLYHVCPIKNYEEISNTLIESLSLLSKDTHYGIYSYVQWLFIMVKDSSALRNSILSVIIHLFYQYQEMRDGRYLEGLNRIVVWVIDHNLVYDSVLTTNETLEVCERMNLNAQLSILLREKVLPELVKNETTPSTVLEAIQSFNKSQTTQKTKRRRK